MRFIPIRFRDAVHLDIQLAPVVKKMEWDINVLVASYMSEFPVYGACCYFLPDCMYQVVVRLVRSIILMFEDGCESRFAVACEFDGAMLDVVYSG